MNFSKRLLTGFLFLFSVSAYCADPCADEFQNRGASYSAAMTAVECLLAQTPEAESLTQAARATALATSKGTTEAEKSAAIESGFTAVSRMDTLGLNSAPYWKAVFVTFKANLEDQGRVLPRHILAAIPEIRNLLETARDRDPATHFNGPDRILGILYLSMPGLVGGDAKKGAALVQKAYLVAPYFTQNALWQAKALLKLKNKVEAAKLLRAMLEPDVLEANADYIPETKDDQAEARKILTKIDK